MPITIIKLTIMEVFLAEKNLSIAILVNWTNQRTIAILIKVITIMKITMLRMIISITIGLQITNKRNKIKMIVRI